jgi:AcrR family transcriptional regulator
MTQRREQKARTRRHIFGVALKLFADQGLLSTTTADIAEAAGVSHGSVFAHFGTRDELVEAVVNEVAGNIATQVRRRSASGRSVREVLSAHLESLAKYEKIYARFVLEGPFLPRRARRALVGIQSAIASQLEEALELERGEGTVRDLPTDLAFNLWIGTLHHYLANRDLFAPRGSVIARVGPRLLEHYTELLAPTRTRRVS